MNKKYIFEKAILYLGRLLRGVNLKNANEIEEVKRIREYLNSMMYEVSRYDDKS